MQWHHIVYVGGFAKHHSVAQPHVRQCPIVAIHIPVTVESITSGAFRNCYQLRDIYCYGTVPPVCSGWLFDGISLSNMTLHYPQGSRDAYKAAVCWKEFFDDHAVEFEPAGIDATTIDKEMNSGNFYDLQGRKMNNQAVSKGLYINNGKKVVIR